jgi:hypothetical protein
MGSGRWCERARAPFWLLAFGLAAAGCPSGVTDGSSGDSAGAADVGTGGGDSAGGADVVRLVR